MKRYMRTSEVDYMLDIDRTDYQYPQVIEIEKYPNKWVTYTKMHAHEGGGCYYKCNDRNDVITGVFVSLYPDGHLTYLWDGYEHDWNRPWRVK